MELPKEWEAIVEQAAGSSLEYQYRPFAHSLRTAVERCYALHIKPRKELTDDDKYQLWLSVWDGRFETGLCKNGSEVVDKIIAAYEAKQREPETVTFRAARHATDGRAAMFPSDTGMNDRWEWLDHDGKAQTFEVKV